jgi:hypothetical protein
MQHSSILPNGTLQTFDSGCRTGSKNHSCSKSSLILFYLFVLPRNKNSVDLAVNPLLEHELVENHDKNRKSGICSNSSERISSNIVKLVRKINNCISMHCQFEPSVHMVFQCVNLNIIRAVYLRILVSHFSRPYIHQLETSL